MFECVAVGITSKKLLEKLTRAYTHFRVSISPKRENYDPFSVHMLRRFL